MIAPGNGLIQVFLAIAFIITSGYALGRIHQWYRDGSERDQAFRTGYDCASRSMFGMALRRQREAVAGGPFDAGPSPETAVPPLRPLVGHARRRIVAGRLGCAAPGGAAR